MGIEIEHRYLNSESFRVAPQPPHQHTITTHASAATPGQPGSRHDCSWTWNCCTEYLCFSGKLGGLTQDLVARGYTHYFHS